VSAARTGRCEVVVGGKNSGERGEATRGIYSWSLGGGRKSRLVKSETKQVGGLRMS